jgi:ABC-type branched-subunit amino acid transport system substrate-binding protein
MFDREPGTFAAMAYNSVFIVKQALEAGGEVTREGLHEALTAMPGFDDLLGAPVEFVDRDSRTEEPILLMTTADDIGAFVAYDGDGFLK